MSFMPEELEVTIRTDNSLDHFEIYASKGAKLTKKVLKVAEIVNEDQYGYRLRAPLKALAFRKPLRLSEEERRARAERVRVAREARYKPKAEPVA
jgi:hypothetical protein